MGLSKQNWLSPSYNSLLISFHKKIMQKSVVFRICLDQSKVEPRLARFLLQKAQTRRRSVQALTAFAVRMVGGGCCPWPCHFVSWVGTLRDLHQMLQVWKTYPAKSIETRVLCPCLLVGISAFLYKGVFQFLLAQQRYVIGTMTADSETFFSAQMFEISLGPLRSGYEYPSSHGG